MNAVAEQVKYLRSPATHNQPMRLVEGIYFQTEMETEWGGLETLLAAAEFVESQEQKRSLKLIEICEEYPSPEKNFSSELVSVQNSTICGGGLSTFAKVTNNAAAAINNSSHTYISSTPATLPSLTNSSSIASVVVTSLPSFSPSPSLTFTFTTPSTASQTGSVMKMPQSTSIRLQGPVVQSRPYQSPLVIQQTSVSYPSSPPSTVPVRNLSHQTSTQQPQNPSAPASVPSLPHRTYPERPVNSDTKRKMSSGTREVHNKLEKNRRAHLKECFELLKSQVPAIQDEKKPSNLTILRTAIRYVQILRRREQELESELERLAREKIVNQQRLTTLKKELSAQWDHIDFNSLIPESIDTMKPGGCVENGASDHKDYDNDKDGYKIVISDIDDSSSHVKSKGDTYYESSSPTGSCSVSSLHISSPNVVTTVSDNLPPQIHIVESPSAVTFEKHANSAVSSLQFLSTSTLRMITDTEPISFMQHNGGDKLSGTTSSLPKMAVHTGNTFTIFSDSFTKINNNGSAATVGVTTNSSNLNSSEECDSNTKLASTTSSSVQLVSDLTSATAASANHKNVAKPGFTQSATPNGIVTTSTLGEKGNVNTAVLTTVPVQSTVASVGNHSFVVTQATSGQMLISTTSQHLPNMVPNPPLLKTVSRLQSINSHQLVIKPATTAVVVVNSSIAATK